MQTNEKTNDRRESAERLVNMFCCGTRGRKEMPDCCKSMWESDDCRSMMGKGMNVCRWFPLIPVIIGIALFLLGYYVNAEVTRVMLMLLAGSLALLGVLGLIMAGWMKKMCC